MPYGYENENPISMGCDAYNGDYDDVDAHNDHGYDTDDDED